VRLGQRRHSGGPHRGSGDGARPRRRGTRGRVHPGGPRILDRLRAALGLSHAQLQDSYDVLTSRGNVGTPSIFYVLNETLRRRPAHGQRGLMVTIGPGVTVGLMLLEF